MTTTIGKFLFIFRVVKDENPVQSGRLVGFRANTTTGAERKANRKASLFGPSAKLIFVKRI